MQFENPGASANFGKINSEHSMSSVRLPKYITSEYQLMLGILVPYSVLLNFLIFSRPYLTESVLFIQATLITMCVKVVAWQLHTLIAMALAVKFPKPADTMRRIGASLLAFVPLTALVNTGIFIFYQKTGLADGDFGMVNYFRVLVSGIGLNTLATFLHEGMSNFEKWKATLTETEQLKTEYAKSRLEGLKTQVNPHFLFNSINTLSSLIGEDPEKAETFLDEMCKVYRYLLKTDEGEFVSLQTELQFLHSWFYILKIRYGHAVRFDMDVDNESLEKRIPPLTLQLLIEHVLNRNMISKMKPLHINISVTNAGWLALQHTVASKITADAQQDDAGLENVINKFRLLELSPMRIARHDDWQVIEIPLT
ncbi:sensor histidine kinase [Dyadobacter fermentans]|uniref:Signal transduction histidine kinase, LytS n=1 Tax=Dyadobacter fermentans (strain ATCC 700827 / DSM 18053 / CIP 107007 / KCTC 52180 / NS114) TaxID=471854 RepID=C6VZJ8_DYAFD|nr:histidine kinase [Dyadobacter fermentans]ACT93476.1 signal transduction histidine kinase, LytS [Dyadobacter fermentans DSM 18053]